MQNRVIYKKHAGFTLTELVIVIIATSVLATTVMMLWPGDVVTVNSQAESLAIDIRYTQLLSMASNTRCRMDLSSSSQYRILNSAGVATTIPSVGTTAVVLQNSLSLSSTSPYLIFDARGVPYTSTTSTDTGTALASNLAITLTGINGSKQIIVSPETGRVIVQ